MDATWGLAQDRHRRAARAILAALTLSTEGPERWPGTALILKVRLNSRELAGLALASLRALDPENRSMVAEGACWGAITGAGMPAPPFVGVMNDARWWAGFATHDERKAYCLATFESLPSADQSAFLRHVQRGAGR